MVVQLMRRHVKRKGIYKTSRGHDRLILSPTRSVFVSNSHSQLATRNPQLPKHQTHQSFIMVLGFGNKNAAQNPTSPTHPTSTSATHPTSTSTTHPGTHTGTTGGTHAVGNGPISGTGYNNYPEVHAHGKTWEGVSGHHVPGSGAHVAGTHLPGKFRVGFRWVSMVVFAVVSSRKRNETLILAIITLTRCVWLNRNWRAYQPRPWDCPYGNWAWALDGYGLDGR